MQQALHDRASQPSHCSDMSLNAIVGFPGREIQPIVYSARKLADSTLYLLQKALEILDKHEPVCMSHDLSS